MGQEVAPEDAGDLSPETAAQHHAGSRGGVPPLLEPPEGRKGGT